MQNNEMSVVQDLKQQIQQSQFSAARKKASDALKKSPSTPLKAELLYLLAVCQRLENQPKAALESLENLLELRPDYGRAHQEMAYCFNALGDEKRAAQSFYQATRYNPALLTSWKALITLYRQQQQNAALQMAQEHVGFLASLPTPVLGATDLMHEGNYVGADKVCRQFLQENKHHPEAMMLLADIDLKRKAYHEAEFLLESCSELYPDNVRVQNQYLNLLQRLGKFERAAEVAQHLLQLHPDDTNTKAALANAYLGVGEVEESVTLYRSLLEEKEDRPSIQLALGNALKAQGQLDEAIEAYKKAARFTPDFGDAYWSLANTKTYRFCDEEIAAMKHEEAKSSLTIDDRIHLQFALAKAYEDNNAFDDAFYWYDKGNALKRSTQRFDIARTEQAMEAQKEACSASLFADGQLGCQSPDPIFIVGLPRAGSTLLEQILASHSMVDGTMELHDILGLVSRISGQKTPYPYNLELLTDTQCKQLGEAYIQQTRAYRKDAPFFIDKMPNNFIHIGFIKRILPNAKIIDARRNAFACCFSGFKQLFGEGQEFSYGLNDIGRYYRAYEKLMDHWNSVLPGQILTVQHEAVVDDLKAQVKRLLNYCDLPFEKACLEFHKTERVIKTPSSEQVRQPIYKSGLAQWRHFEAHLTPLFNALEKTPD